MVDWNQKIVAYLHDPADKPFDIPGHETRAKSAIGIALGREVSSGEWAIARKADHWASAADRPNFPPGLQVDFRAEPALTHPLSGRRKLDLDNLRTVDERGALDRAVHQLCDGESDPQRKFLRLWRNLTNALDRQAPDIGALWQLLPADTRSPDHPLPQHMSVTSALAGAGEHPAFLVMSVGPVQDFIRAARRTQDLWVGSFLLSYLTWGGIRSIVQAYGPDAVLFPSLLDQPMVDHWLDKEGIVPLPQQGKHDFKERLAIANWPNKFTALLPAAEAEQAARAAEDAVRAAWASVAEAVRSYLVTLSPELQDRRKLEDWQKIWERQVASLPEVYWSVLDWPPSPDEALTQYKKWLGECPDFERVYDLFKKKGREGGGQYYTNLGTVYQLLYDLAERGFGARKGLRDFHQANERGEQCSIVPGYAALHTGDWGHDGVRKYWKSVADALEANKQFSILKSGGECLSAVGAIKRFAAQQFFGPEFGVEERFPSTTTITVLPFYEVLAERLLSEPEFGPLDSTVRAFTSALCTAGIPRTANYNSLPAHLRRAVNALGQQAEAMHDLLQYDGDWLYTESYDSGEYPIGVRKDDLPDVKRRLQDLLKATRDVGIDAPPRYYAVLLMDGDSMGRWLSGTHKDMPTFAALTHPKTAEELEQRSTEWSDFAGRKRLVSPAYHAAISRALGNFALKCVRRIVEELHPGVLVYAGGDDVLALLPLEHALPVALELRAAFSGQSVIDHDGVKDTDFVSEQHSGYMALDGQPLLTMGPSATASTGIAIAHHSSPLSGVLAAAREAEHAAKEYYDRNALAVTVLKRSGEVMRVGARWHYGVTVPNSVTVIQEFRTALDSQFSGKLPYEFFAEARTLSGLGSTSDDALKAELRRLLKRHQDSQADISVDGIAQWAERLSALAVCLQSHRKKVEQDQDRRRTLAEEDELPQPGAVELGKWLLLARFLNRGGEE